MASALVVCECAVSFLAMLEGLHLKEGDDYLGSVHFLMFGREYHLLLNHGFDYRRVGGGILTTGAQTFFLDSCLNDEVRMALHINDLWLTFRAHDNLFCSLECSPICLWDLKLNGIRMWGTLF